MKHLHSVYDSDVHFKINGITREVSNVSEVKTRISQFDHNSERFTFELPRFIDGHDMSSCNVIQIHYINGDIKNKELCHKDVYEVSDIQVSPESEDVVIFSWLVSSNATQYVGYLSFCIRFCCVTGDTPDYTWSTAIHSAITVTASIYNGEAIAVEYADILEQWRKILGTKVGSAVTHVDLSALDTDGKIVETCLDGTVLTTTIMFDGNGNPVKITDGYGNETVLVW